jgi:uncharacterized membrane protein (UPF0182 family)
VAQDPGVAVKPAQGAEVTNEQGETVATREQRIEPYYQLLELPGSDGEDFVLVRPFVPLSENDTRKQLTAFMSANSDEDEYGELTVYELPPNEVDGPAVVGSNILTEDTVSRELTLLGQQGSKIKFGDLQLVPIGNSLLYVRPLYAEAEGPTAVPELKRVIVVFGDEVVMENTLEAALERLFDVEVTTREEVPDGDDGDPGEPPVTTTVPPTTGPDDTTPPDDATINDLLRAAEVLFAEADEAFADGDLVLWAEKVTEARELVGRASALLAGDGGGSGSSGEDADEPDEARSPDSTATTASSTTIEQAFASFGLADLIS